MKNKGSILLIIALLLGFWGYPSPLFAHGASIKYASNMTYQIDAAFDDGTPMANAQVLVYAPDNPAKPWKKAITNEKGVYHLSPDLTKTGLWLVQVRKAGHGAAVNIQIDKGQFVSGDTGLSKTQLVLMTVSVLWGFVGTALYFSRRKG